MSDPFVPGVSRRGLLKGGGAAVAGWSVLRVSGRADASSGERDDRVDVPWTDGPSDGSNECPDVAGGQVIDWLDQPADVPPPAQGVVGKLLKWEALASRLTPADNFFTVKHYDLPVLDPNAWRLSIEGLVARPMTLSLADLRARPRRRVEFTLECSGNTGLPFFIGGIGNAVWGGAQLAPLLKAARMCEDASEVVFWGADAGTVTIRDDSGVTSAGATGIGEADAGGGLDLTITEHFARSMSVKEALAAGNLLSYEMNGAPLPGEHGAPVRLIAPGWYGVASVKWLTKIEVIDRRFTGRFMARDYVTFREQTIGGETVWTFTNVGRARLKSAPAKVTRHGNQHTVIGVAWGGPIARVEVSIDGGPWQQAARCGQTRHGASSSELTWQFWTYDWGTPAPGTHTVASRATDDDGNLQPAPDDPFLASKRTYWENNGHIQRTIVIT
jgi:DMSO/TMAO reductase YedYZ molybdopterin-dependent catalytic subunit